MESTAVNPHIYPIGKYTAPPFIDAQMRSEFLQRIETLPARLRNMAEQLNENQLASSYREGGWSARQIIYHLADSHCNFYIRVKLALTADQPTINPYDENQWAEFDEAKHGNILIALQMIDVLHRRLVASLRSTDVEQFKKTYVHPQYNTTTSIDQALALYAWHGDHHLAQIGVVRSLYP
ncbi:MAG: YfiT family bacillithiol transferase [Flavobacteriales bacterium]